MTLVKPEIAVYSVPGQCLYTDLRLIKIKEGKWENMDHLEVYKVTRKEGSCEQRQQTPCCSDFPILLNKSCTAQGDVCRADFSGINIVPLFGSCMNQLGEMGS